MTLLNLEYVPTDQQALHAFFRSVAKLHPKRDQIQFICIGSDRSSGDSFGPLVGTMLQQRGWRVTGTLKQPCDAHGVEPAIAALDQDRIIIAVDACLGKSVGQYIMKDKPLQPGQAIGRRLPPVGHYSVAGVVNEAGPKPYWKLQTTSLYLVLQMANKVVHAVSEAWQPLDSSQLNQLEGVIIDDEC
ncbi:spore protease YyaC [Paenibacillus sp. GCM10023252]|uniref:spore protease YyaC n=1 Tax=Paenibacillus sp. GCM10023252 TaxID=3252649 RepID=UPI003608B633